MIIRRNFLATAFETYKQINNWCNCVHVPVSEFSCKWCGRRERQFLKTLIQALWNVALFELVKGEFPQENIAYTYSAELLKKNALSYTKTGKFSLLYEFLTTYIKIIIECPRISF
jgi:hypothetical protein